MVPVGIAESARYIAHRPGGARDDTDRCLRHLPDRLTPYLAPMLPHTDRARAASRTGGSSTSESRAQRCAAGVRDDLGSRTGAWRGVFLLVLDVAAHRVVEDLPLVSFDTLTYRKRTRRSPCRSARSAHRGSARSSRISRSPPLLNPVESNNGIPASNNGRGGV
jgi:hypothetical protein